MSCRISLVQATERLMAARLPGPKPYYVTGESPQLWFEPGEVWEIRGADLTLSPVHKVRCRCHAAPQRWLLTLPAPALPAPAASSRHLRSSSNVPQPGLLVLPLSACIQ